MTKKIKKPTNTKIKKEYYQNFGELDEMNEIGSEYIIVSLDKGAYIFRFSFETQEDVHCCGLYSVGNFRIISNSSVIPTKEKISFIKNVFAKLANLAKTTNTKEHTLFFTLIKNPACDLIKEAIKDEKHFTAVKSFINSNSGVRNTLYVSN